MNRIKELRASHGLKQSDIASMLNVRQTTVSHWENDVTEIDRQNLFALADYFEVTTDYLLGKSNIPNPVTDPDDEMWELRREMAERSEMKTLFSLAKTADKETIEFANEMIKRMRKDSGYSDD